MKTSNSLKTALKMIVLVVGAACLGLLLMWLVYLLPVEPMAKNIIKSYDTINNQETVDFAKLSVADFPEVYDAGTNIIIFQEVIYHNTDTPFEDSILVPNVNVWMKPMNEWSEGLLEVAEDGVKSTDDITTYARYWHGYLVLQKPLLSIMDVQTMYTLNTIVLCLLVIMVSYFMYKRLGLYSLAYILTILCMYPENIVQSLQLSSVFYALNITMLLLLIKKDWKPQQIYAIFALDGILIAFFDFLTYPLVAASIPLLTYFLLHKKENLLENFMDMVKNGISFVWGYAGMWGMKWVFATLFTEQNIIKDAIDSVLQRTGVVENSNDSIMTWGVIESITRNFDTFFNTKNCIILLVSVLVMVVVLIWKRNELKINRQILLFAFLIMLTPIAWLIALNNHCALHPHLEWRTVCVALFALTVFVISLFSKEYSLQEK